MQEIQHVRVILCSNAVPPLLVLNFALCVVGEPVIVEVHFLDETLSTGFTLILFLIAVYEHGHPGDSPGQTFSDIPDIQISSVPCGQIYGHSDGYSGQTSFHICHTQSFYLHGLACGC